MGILTQKTGWSAEEIEARVPIVIATHGAEGSTIALTSGENTVRHRIRAAKIEGEALDPTGVGDAFRAGLLRGVRAGLSWEIAGRMGSVAAVFALEHQGPQPPGTRSASSRALRTELRRRAGSLSGARGAAVQSLPLAARSRKRRRVFRIPFDLLSSPAFEGTDP